MALLEIVCGGSDVLKAAFAVQRQRLEQELPVVSIDISGVARKDRQRILDAIDVAEIRPKAVLIRGVDQVDRIVPAIGKIPFFVDHCTPVELGRQSPLRNAVVKASRIYCYSQSSDTELRRTGIGRITVVSGPTLPGDRDWRPGVRPTVAVLKMCSKANQVLARILMIKKQRHWDFDIVSPISSSKVTQVANNFEAVEAADFVVAPYEDKDFGQPHEGAILSLALGKPMTTARTGAFTVMGFPSDSFIPAKKYQIGTYAIAIGNYLKNRAEYDGCEWASGPDPYSLPNDLLTRI